MGGRQIAASALRLPCLFYAGERAIYLKIVRVTAGRPRHNAASFPVIAAMKLLVLCLILATSVTAFGLSDSELSSIGRRVWQNECGGTRDGLTSWNSGESFASLGIGHFIWYPKGTSGPFEESFPKLTAFLAKNGTAIPEWMRGGCPWVSRAEFQAAFHGEKMNALRDLLAATIHLQARFLAQRMQEALPKMEAAAPAGERAKIRTRFEQLAATSRGTFALVDYVNFKGEGIKETERYRNEGWGLLQALENMGESGDAAKAFSESAAAVLERRVKNAPPERHEERWLAGWKSRVRAYGE